MIHSFEASIRFFPYAEQPDRLIKGKSSLIEFTMTNKYSRQDKK